MKWGGAAVTVLLVVVWIGSGWLLASYPTSSGRVWMVGRGCFSSFLSDRPGGFGDTLSLHSVSTYHLQFLPSSTEASPTSHTHWREWNVPMWILAVPVLAAAAIAWRLDTLARRRARLNLCQKCNYDRTGLAAGAVCSGVREVAVMKPHPRIRKTVKWGGAAVLVIVFAWAASGWWWAVWWLGSGWRIGIGRGQVSWESFIPFPGFPKGVEWHRMPSGPTWDFGFKWNPSSTFGGINIPLWALAVLVVGLTAAVAWLLNARDRRRGRAGRCSKCNYDLTGLVAGAVCPECGSGGSGRVPS